jgi:antitoxin component of MazEF toxin-antitoxin module
LAGIGDDGVMSAILSHLSKGDEVDFRVGGLVMPAHEHVLWKELKLNIGDEIRVKIVESKVVDKSRVVHRRVLAKAMELGWKIIARPKKVRLQ